MADQVRCEDCGKLLRNDDLGMEDCTLSPCEVSSMESSLDTVVHELSRVPGTEEAIELIRRGQFEMQKKIKEAWPRVPWPNF